MPPAWIYHALRAQRASHRLNLHRRGNLYFSTKSLQHRPIVLFTFAIMQSYNNAIKRTSNKASEQRQHQVKHSQALKANYNRRKEEHRMTNTTTFNYFDIRHIISIIDNINEERKSYEWKKKYTPEFLSTENREAREIRRLGQYLEHVINRTNRLNQLRGY